MRIFFSLVLLLFFCKTNYAQDFHRTYKLQDDEQTINLGAVQMSDDFYLSMDGIIIDSTFRNIIFTNYDKKGTIVWGRELSFDESDSLRILPTGCSIIQAENDSIYFTLTLFKSDGPNKYIGSMSNDGNMGWSKVVNDNSNADQTDQNYNLLTAYFDSSFVQTANVGSSDFPEQILTQLDYSGNLMTAAELTASFDQTPVTHFIGDVKMKEDSSLMITGSVLELGTYYLHVLDSMWNPVITQTFGDNVNDFSIYGGLSIEETPDTGYVISGQFLNLDIFNFPNSYIGSFIAKHNSTGDVVWSKRLEWGANEPNIISQTLVNEDGSIIVVGTAADGTDGATFMSKLDASGNTIWNKAYTRMPVPLFALGEAFQTSDGGYAYFHTGLVNNVQAAANFIKTNGEGSTTCEDTLSRELFEDIPLIGVDYDVQVIARDDVSLDDFGSSLTSFDAYGVPDVTLETKIFCPNEPIDWVFDAGIEGGVKYEWNTGDTTDTLRVFDDEQYTVTVTVETEVCYTLCDTVALDRYDLPMITASYRCVGDDPVMYELLLDANGVAAGVDSIFWSTGDINVNTITVDQKGTYSVRVIDACGEEAEAIIDVNPGPPVFDALYNCREEGINLFVNFPPSQIKSISWSTGPQDDGQTQVLVQDQGVYSVTLTDICDETTVKEINVDPAPPAFDVLYNCREEGINLFFEGILASNILSTSWSTGAQDDDKNQITVQDQGTYSVTVTDICRETVVKQVNVDPPTPDVSGSFECLEQGIRLFVNPPNSGIGDVSWSTGAQDDGKSEIIVPDQGTYGVTVTDFCKEVVDFEIVVDPAPIVINPDVLCGANTFTINSNIDPNQVISINWNTGSMESSITVTDPGVYTITVVDFCKEESVQDVTIDMLPDEVTIDADFSTACNNGPVTLTATANGEVMSYAWTTGQDTMTIFVTDPGIYQVTAIDVCGNALNETITILEEDFPIDADGVTIDVDYGSYCLTEMVTLTAQVIGSTTGYVWSTGDEGQVITVSPNGEPVSVTAQDECGGVSNSTDALFIPPAEVQFPNAFFGPNVATGGEEIDPRSLEFGGFLTPEFEELEISNYELHVFNRLGQEVFSSTNITDRWNGTLDSGELALPDVYVWYATWDTPDCSFEEKGDVTYIR